MNVVLCQWRIRFNWGVLLDTFYSLKELNPDGRLLGLLPRRDFVLEEIVGASGWSLFTYCVLFLVVVNASVVFGANPLPSNTNIPRCIAVFDFTNPIDMATVSSTSKPVVPFPTKQQ